jgi:biotin transport system substrate-specific component
MVAGAAGLPVFSGLTGGLGVLVGPTGGYLWGFAAGAVVGAWVRERLECAGAQALVSDATAAVLVVVVTYALGAAQLAVVANMGSAAALAAGVAPFILPDVAKAAAAVGVAAALRRARVASRSGR